MNRACLKLTGYNSDTQVDGLKVDGKRLLGSFSLNTCVVISPSFDKNMGDGDH